MAYVGKWFGFGKNEQYDKAIRDYEAGDLLSALEAFRIVSQSESNLILRQRSKSYLAGTLGRLGREAISKKDFQQAIDYLGEAVVLRPRYADLHLALAFAHDALGQFSKRNEELDAALRINPNYGMAALFQGSLMITSGDHGNGLARVIQAVSLDRRLETDVFRKGIQEADANQWEDAARTFRTVRPESQEDPDIMAIRGDRMMVKGDYAEAAQAFRLALELGPNYPDLHVRYGQALLETNQVQQAADEFRDAISMNPKYAEAHALLGIAYRRLKQEEAAMASFQMALEIDPSHVIAAQEILNRRRH